MATLAPFQTDAVRYFGKNGGVRYPSPFFDVAGQHMPESQHRLLQWCTYYFFTNPLINVACWKLAEYPVTELMFTSATESVNQLYSSVYNQLRIRSFEIEVGLDYFCCGNAFVSLYTPFLKILQCASCKQNTIASKVRSAWKWRDNQFWLKCPHCKNEAHARATDAELRDVSGISLVRWNPEQIDIVHNPSNNRSRYYYRVPPSLMSQVQQGDRDILETTPQVFLDAIRLRQSVLFSPSRIYHLKRPNIAGKDQGWGLPIIYPLLKDAFYMQIMKKAQESLLMEYVVPMRMMFPGTNGSVNEPGGASNITAMMAKMTNEIRNWRIDPNYIMQFPMNVGFQQWGGTGKALILHQEFRVHGEQMLAGAGIPQEFIYGGASWSASNTSLRALANMFENFNAQRHDLIQNFIFQQLATFMRWPAPVMEYDPFRMADDLQKSMHLMQLSQANFIPRAVVQRYNGFSPAKMRQGLREENSDDRQINRDTQVAAANVAAEVAAVQSRQQRKDMTAQMIAQTETQAKLAPLMQPPMPPGGDPSGGGAGAPQGGGGGDQAAGAGAAPGAPMPPAAPAMQPMTSISPGPGPSPVVPVALAGQQAQVTDPVTGMSAVDAARGWARALQDPAPASDIQARNRELSATAPQNVSSAAALLSQHTGSRVNPLNALMNPSGAGSAPQTDSGRVIG